MILRHSGAPGGRTTVRNCAPENLAPVPGSPLPRRPRMTEGSVGAEHRSRSANAVADHVAGAADGMEQRPIEALVDLGTQPRNMHVDHVGLRIEVIVPDI